MKGALAKHAESTYTTLPSEEHRHLARALFLRLIDPGISEQDTTRRRAALAELSLPDVKQNAMIQQVVDAFITARLLTTSEVAGTITIEVSHEALIREWPRLSDWLREGREDIHLQQAISQDAAQWERHGKPKDRLYRGSQLKEAKAWTQRNVPSEQEMAFLRTCAAHQTRSRASVAALVLVLVLALGLAVPIFQAQQLAELTTVSNLHDAGPGSLRQAIDRAPDGATITFSKNLQGTIQLTNGNLSIGKNLTIQGPGAGNLTISSGSRGYAIQVVAGASVSITGLAFKNSTVKSVGSGSPESFISNNGTLFLRNSTISGNTAAGSNGNGGSGGGITNNGTLTLINSIVSGNTAAVSSGGTYSSGGGGGIYNTGTFTLTNSSVSDNTAAGNTSGSSGGNYGSGGSGGGIYNTGTFTLTNSSVSGNRASSGIGGSKENGNYGGSGGGIYSSNNQTGSSSTVNIIKSNISRNVASGGSSGTGSNGGGSGGSGGGIYLYDSGGGSTFTLIDSIVSENTAAESQRNNNNLDFNNGGSGGGIFAQYYSSSGGSSTTPLTLTLTNSTVSGNTAAGSGSHDGGGGGGIYNMESKLTVTNSTISGNTAAGGSVGDSNSKNGTDGSGGGGIFNSGSGYSDSSSHYIYGELTLINSTISSNSATSSGGGIIDYGGKTDMTFCTTYGNTAANGGGIATGNGYDSIFHSATSSTTYKPVSDSVQMRNSIVANDHASTGPDIAGTLTSGGYNLIENTPGATFAIPLDKHQTDVLVDPSTDLKIDSQLSGRQPQIHALLPGSPALNSIPLDACHPNGASTDQHGMKRPDGNDTMCDIGAYEYVPAR